MLSGQSTGAPKSRDGIVESIRTLHVVTGSAIKARTQAGNQMTNLIVTAPEATRAELRGLTALKRAKRAASWRPGTGHDPVTVTRRAIGDPGPPLADPDPGDQHSDQRTRRAHPPRRPRPDRPARRRQRRRREAPHHRRRQPPADPDRGRLRCALRRQPHHRIIRKDHPSPAQQVRRPPGEQRPLDHRQSPPDPRPRHRRLRPTANRRRTLTPRHRPLHQALPRPRTLPHPHRRPHRIDIGVSAPLDATSPRAERARAFGGRMSRVRLDGESCERQPTPANEDSWTGLPTRVMSQHLAVCS